MKESKNKSLLRYIKWRSKENTMQYIIGTYPIFVYKIQQQRLLEIAKAITSLPYYSEAICAIHEHADAVGIML